MYRLPTYYYYAHVIKRKLRIKYLYNIFLYFCSGPSEKKPLLMLTGGNDGIVKMWKLLDNEIEFKMKFIGHGSDITCVKFPRNITTFLASTSLDKTARIWQTVYIFIEYTFITN